MFGTVKLSYVITIRTDDDNDPWMYVAENLEGWCLTSSLKNAFRFQSEMLAESILADNWPDHKDTAKITTVMRD